MKLHLQHHCNFLKISFKSINIDKHYIPVNVCINFNVLLSKRLIKCNCIKYLHTEFNSIVLSFYNLIGN